MDTGICTYESKLLFSMDLKDGSSAGYTIFDEQIWLSGRENGMDYILRE